METWEKYPGPPAIRLKVEIMAHYSNLFLGVESNNFLRSLTLQNFSSNSILSKSYLNCTKYYAFKFEVVLTRPQFDLIAQLDRSRIINRYGYLGYPKNFVEAKL